jgi:hypothetical protein
MDFFFDWQRAEHALWLDDYVNVMLVKQLRRMNTADFDTDTESKAWGCR